MGSKIASPATRRYRERNRIMENFTIVYPSGVKSSREAVSHLDALAREWDDAGAAPVEWVETWSRGGWDFAVTDDAGHAVYFKEVTPDGG